MLEARVLRVGLDALEGRLGAHPLDLELGDEDRHLAAGALRIDDRPLRREEPEAGEVLDVGLVEQDVPRASRAAHVLEQPLTARPQLVLGDAVTQLHVLLHFRWLLRSRP